ncbi:hypothetical protein OFM04_34240, partial [Escherichia coli]|nr:hypothetical protein [Escherichia coli]
LGRDDGTHAIALPSDEGRAWLWHARQTASTLQKGGVLFLFGSGIVAYSDARHGRSTAMNQSWIGPRA